MAKGLTGYLPPGYAERIMKSSWDKQVGMIESFKKMMGATDEDIEKNPSLRGKLSGMMQRANEREQRQVREAEILAMYGSSSKEYGDFLASKRATFDPRRGF